MDMEKLQYSFKPLDILDAQHMNGISGKVDEIVDALNEGTGVTVRVNEDTGTLQFIL